ncbi:hypothetical protein CL3_12010 [butyrate-producing bacterium SM4/1]|nr:hypothetical protein CL3_12010 [butyrate-producing bacterium SM4/1]
MGFLLPYVKIKRGQAGIDTLHALSWYLSVKIMGKDVSRKNQDDRFSRKGSEKWVKKAKSN